MSDAARTVAERIAVRVLDTQQSPDSPEVWHDVETILDAFAAQVWEEANELREALIAAQQFLSPEIDRGPLIDGWQNTVDMVVAALRAAQKPTP